MFRAPTIISLLILLTACTKHELNRKMEAMCQKDGGLKVYEEIKLKANEFEQGHKRLYRFEAQGKRENLLGPDYLLIERFENVAGVTGNIWEGYVERYTTQVVRRRDNKLLGESIIYARVGGDGPLGIVHWQPTSNQCPLVSIDIVNEVFKLEVEK